MNSNLIRRLGATAVAVLLLIYVAYQVYLSQYTGVETETAMFATVSDSIDTTGFIIRDEYVIKERVNGVLNYTVDDGEKTAAGGTIAEIYPTEEDAAMQNRIARIDDELNRLSVLENPGDFTSSNPKLIGSQISKKITSILTNIKAGSLANIADDKNDLQLLLGQKQIITGAEETEAYTAHIDQLRRERAELVRTGASSIGSIKSPAAGYFIQNVDGYENIVEMDKVRELTIDDINNLLDEDSAKKTGKNVLGKVAMDFGWYVVCVIDENDFVRLDRTTKVTIEMPFASVDEIPAEIVRINYDKETGGAALIIECTYMNNDLAAARKEPLRININRYSGVLVNEKAIHFEDITVTETDENGVETEVVHENVMGVYVKYGSRLRFVQVISPATVNGYAICKIDLSSEERKQILTEKTLQLYDEVVVEGTNLYDGKIL